MAHGAHRPAPTKLSIIAVDRSRRTRRMARCGDQIRCAVGRTRCRTSIARADPQPVPVDLRPRRDRCIRGLICVEPALRPCGSRAGRPSSGSAARAQRQPQSGSSASGGPPMRTRRSPVRPPPDAQDSLERAKPLFRAWGAQGGRARAKRLTSEERSDAARKAVQVRWKGLSKAQRAALARKAALARWSKKRAERASKGRPCWPRIHHGSVARIEDYNVH